MYVEFLERMGDRGLREGLREYRKLKYCVVWLWLLDRCFSVYGPKLIFSHSLFFRYGWFKSPGGNFEVRLIGVCRPNF